MMRTQAVPKGTKRGRSTAMKKTMMYRMQMYMCMMGMYTLCVHTPRCGLVG